MVNYRELMQILSVPRPNGSDAVCATSRALQSWLAQRGITFRIHTFRIYPFFFEWIGLWLMVSRALLVLGILLRWGWLVLLIALLGLLGGVVDIAFNFPLVSWMGMRRGENILIEFEPSDPRREVIFSAHYDSKTELLDHTARLFFHKRVRIGIFLSLLLGLMGPLDRWLLDAGSPWAGLTYWSGIVLSVPLLFLAWGLGLNLSLGRLLEPSQGAVDNGAACAILLGLAGSLESGDIKPQQTKVTIALFAGEEVNLQGSRAYVCDRSWDLPTVAINMEVMAQNGSYVFWEMDGNAFWLVPTTREVNDSISGVVAEVTGHAAQPAGPLNSDGFSFLSAGIPTGVLGTIDASMKFSGFHRPTDHIGRVVIKRLPEGVEILSAWLRRYDQGEVSVVGRSEGGKSHD